MRTIRMIATAAVITTLGAVVGVTFINAKSAKPGSSSAASKDIGILQLMQEAKDLPVQQYDAF
jgi:hypothetical protein